MKFIKDLPLEGAKLIEFKRQEDNRGAFIKVYHKSLVSGIISDFEIKESYYSLSNKDVIRGMHFQHPPYDHAKLVFCPVGAIMDVILDLRVDSPSFGQYYVQELSADNNLAMYIPKGFAHGFKSLSDDSMTFYFVSTEYHPDADKGVLYNSFGIDWELDNPIVSKRDLEFPHLKDYISAF